MLAPVEHHPYLGIELDNKLCWKQQVTNVRSKGTRTLNMVRRNFTKGSKPDLHKPCPPSPGIWKPSVGPLPTGSNPASGSRLCRTKQHDTSIRIGREPRV